MLQRGIYLFLFLLWFLMAMVFVFREDMFPNWEPTPEQAKGIRYFYIGACVFALLNALKFANVWRRQRRRANAAGIYAPRVGSLAAKESGPAREDDPT